MNKSATKKTPPSLEQPSVPPIPGSDPDRISDLIPSFAFARELFGLKLYAFPPLLLTPSSLTVVGRSCTIIIIFFRSHILTRINNQRPLVAQY